MEQTSTTPEPLTLTFGVELEFILRFELADYATQLADDGDAWSAAAEEFARVHLVTVLTEQGYPVCSDAQDFTVWDLGCDSSIKADGPSTGPEHVRYGYTGVELRSPALPYTAESLIQIREVFQLLFSKFDTLVNESCALHVHVGNERKGFPLETMKNLCILTTTFERELESLHPSHRIGNTFSSSTGLLFEGISPWDIRRIIRSMQTVNDLTRLIQENAKSYAYNLLNLKSSRGKQTFEFRQHQAIVDVDAIIKWVELTCGLVGKAHQFAIQGYFGVGEMDRYLDKMYFVPNRSIVDVLTSLGLEEVAKYYDRRGLFTHQRSPWVWADPNQEDAMEPWVMPEDAISFGGQQIIRKVANSKENRDRYEKAVLECASTTSIHVPCECNSEGVEGSGECFSDSWDCPSSRKLWTTASTSGLGWDKVEDHPVNPAWDFDTDEDVWVNMLRRQRRRRF